MQNDIQSLLIQNRLLTEEVKRRIDQLGAINTVAATVSQSLDLDKTLRTALKAVLDVIGVQAGGISLIDDRAGEVVLRAQQGWPHDFVDPPMRIPLGRGMSGRVIAMDDVVVDNDMDGSENLAVPQFHEENFRSIVMAPMHAHGKIIGILSIMSTQPNSFSNEIINMLKAVADTVGVAIDNARLYETTSEHETRLNAIFHTTADGLIATDRNGLISMINRSAAMIFDVDAEKLIGTPLREAPLHPRIRESLLYALSSHTRESKSFQATLENGKLVSVIISPVFFESQVEQQHESDGWLIVLQDISHLREAEVKRAEFMRAAAHDMKNPLGVTMSSLHMLEDYYATNDATAKEIIRIALNGVQRLQGLINDLLQIEQLESGIGIQKSEVDLAALIPETLNEVKPIFQEKHISTNLDIADGLPRIQGDSRWLKRAIINYLDNAAKYTPAGGSITLKAFGNAPQVHIEITDNGQGIPTEAQGRLFERFYRAATDEKIQGSGLGLAIVKSIAEAHDGSVYVRSELGKGSTFGMILHVGTAL